MYCTGCLPWLAELLLGGKKKNTPQNNQPTCVIVHYPSNHLLYNIISNAARWKLGAQTILGKAEGEKQCRQLIMCYICYGKCHDVLDGIGHSRKHTFFPLLAWRVGKIRNRVVASGDCWKWICIVVSAWYFGIILSVCVNIVIRQQMYCFLL